MKHPAKPLAAAALLAALFLVSGCVSDYSGTTYSQAEARRQQTVYYGVLQRIDPVVIEGNEGTVGAIAGGAVGGALGSGIGGGSGNTIATVVGAVAGAAVGAMAERNATTKQAYAFEVLLDSGETLSVVQTPGSDTFTVGNRVRVLVGADGTTRIRPE